MYLLVFFLFFPYSLLCEGFNIIEQKGCFEANSLEEFYDIKKDAISYRIEENNGTFNNESIEKSILLQITELAQFNKIPVNYIVIGEEGLAHEKTFTIELHLGDEKYEGIGSSKKNAKREAAKRALSQTSYEKPLYVDLKTDTETPSVQLNNLGLKLGMFIQYHLVEHTLGRGKKFISLDGNKINLTDLEYRDILKNQADYIPKGPFTVRVSVGDDRQYFGFSHSIQGARHEAAKQAISSINTEDNPCYEEGPASINCKILKDNLKSPISKLYELAKFHKFSVEYNLIKEHGPNHEKHFVTECRFGDIVVEGDGTSKKKSKKVAAESMLSKIEQFGFKHSRIIDNKSTNNKKSNKLSKTGKDSLIKYVDKTKNSWTSDIKDDTEEDKKRKNRKIKITKSPKNELIQVGKLAGIHVEFTDLGEKQGKFYSVVFLGVEPWQLCVGNGETQQLSEASTSLYALKYLYENIIFDKSIVSEEIKRLILDEELQYSLVYEEITS